jgi:hypothetical protein
MEHDETQVHGQVRHGESEMNSHSSTHPRNGYAVIRMVFALDEGFPGPVGGALSVVSALGSETDRPMIYLDGEVDEESPLPLHQNWRLSHSYVRLLSREFPLRVTWAEHLFAVAHNTWKVSGYDESLQRLIIDREANEKEEKYYFEIVSGRSVTLDCNECQRTAIGYTAATAIRTVQAISEGFTYALEIPFAPLPVDLHRHHQAVHVREFNLSGELHRDHGVELVSQLDPRSVLLDQHPEQTMEETVLGLEVMNAITNEYETARYFDFMSEAYYSLHITDNYSSVVVLAAQACESILDSVLLHMKWWDGASPDETGAVLTEAVTKRVQSHYRTLGGTWDIPTSVELGAWKTNVADVRNRVAHGGKPATYGEGYEALTSARRLYEFLCDISTSDRARSVYPVLSTLLDSKREDPLKTRREREAVSWFYRDAQGWRAFEHFHSLVNRARWIAYGNPLLPSIKHSEPYISISRSCDEIEWWIYDPETHHVLRAIPAEVDSAALPELFQEFRSQMRPGVDRDFLRIGLDQQLVPETVDAWEKAEVAIPYLLMRRAELNPPLPA